MTRVNCTHDLRTQGQLRFQTVDFYPQVPAGSPLCHQSVRGERFSSETRSFAVSRIGLEQQGSAEAACGIWRQEKQLEFFTAQSTHEISQGGSVCIGTFAQDGCSKLKGKESVAWLLQNSNAHKAMSCINYMKSQISLGEPHSIEGHHHPALSRLARVPRPASSKSAKQQWVCKKIRGHKMPGRRIKSSAQRLHKRPHL